jgi:phospholipase/carboxylesterase
VIVRERLADGEAEGALVLFHGRGADEHDLFPLLDALDPKRRLDGFTPRGPLYLPPGGAHWYIVPRVGYPDRDTFTSTYDEVSAWLDTLPHEQVVLAGFSQGAVMSYAFGLGRGRPRPAAILAFSGFVPQVEGFELDLDPPLPSVMIAHGSLDPVIPVEFGRAARDLLTAAGADVVYRESPIPHAIDPRAVDDARRRLDEALATRSV